jgi:Xaa-Pro dipeptidase
MTDAVRARRADIDTKQAILTRIFKALECEAAILFMPAHVAWFTGGMTTRGLIADGERPGIYTNGRQRWLVCGNADSHRLFDEELDGLGFMLKEWQWPVGRAALLGELVAGKQIASDRPFPGLPLVNDILRPELRPLLPSDRANYLALGATVAHALEATARAIRPGETEAEAVGQLANRVARRGAEPVTLSAVADDRGRVFRRAGFTDTPIRTACHLQLTALRNGLSVTAGRTVWFGDPDAERKAAFDAAVRVSAVYRACSKPGQSGAGAVDTGVQLLRDGPFEHEWRLSQPGFGAGWFAADELRKAGVDEKFVSDQPLTWQARIGGAAVVDTVLVSESGAVTVTPAESWPVRRVVLNGTPFDVPDALVRTE